MFDRNHHETLRNLWVEMHTVQIDFVYSMIVRMYVGELCKIRSTARQRVSQPGHRTDIVMAFHYAQKSELLHKGLSRRTLSPPFSLRS